MNLCGTTLVPAMSRHLNTLYRADPAQSTTQKVFGALLKGDTPPVAYCLAPDGSSLKSGGRRDVSLSSQYLLGWVVVPTKLQVGEFVGGFGNGVLGLSFGGGVHRGAYQRFQTLRNLFCNV